MNAVNPLSPLQRQPDRHAEPSMEEILASIRRIIADDQALPEPAAPRDRVIEPPPPLRSLLRDRAAEAPAAAPPARDEASGLAAYGQVMAPQFPSPTGPSQDASHEASHEALHDARQERFEHAFEEASNEAPQDEPPFEAPAGGIEDEAHTAPAAAVAVAVEAPPTLQQDRPMRDQLARDPDAGPDPSGRRLPEEPAARGGLFSDATDRSLSSAFSMLAATRLVDDSETLRSMAREMIRPLLKEWLDDNLPSLVERLVRAEIERVARGGR